MRKKTKETNNNNKSIFTNLDKDIKRENQVYVNEEIMEAVIDAKRKSSQNINEDLDVRNDIPIPSTLDNNPSPQITITEHEAKKDFVDELISDNSQEGEPHPDDLDIYDSLFSETTIVSTQIYTYEIDKGLGEDNFTSDCVYRVGQDTTEVGSIFTVTKKMLKTPINVKRPNPSSDINWYNSLADLGYSYAAVCGTTVQGVIICEPQFWNNTLYIRRLMVAKQFRNNGIGKKLIDECVHRAQVEGFRAMALEVTSSNGAAIEFYKKMHFNIVGLNVGLYSNSDILKEDVGLFMHRVII